jgi:hypothetical protein
VNFLTEPEPYRGLPLAAAGAGRRQAHPTDQTGYAPFAFLALLGRRVAKASRKVLTQTLTFLQTRSYIASSGSPIQDRSNGRPIVNL